MLIRNSASEQLPTVNSSHLKTSIIYQSYYIVQNGLYSIIILPSGSEQSSLQFALERIGSWHSEMRCSVPILAPVIASAKLVLKLMQMKNNRVIIIRDSTKAINTLQFAF